jgi:hypothetical protein
LDILIEPNSKKKVVMEERKIGGGVREEGINGVR